MSENKPDREALETAKGLTEALTGMAGQLQAVNDRQDRAEEREQAAADRSRKRWHIVLGVIVSLMLDLVLTCLLAVTYAQGRHTSATVSELHATNISACRIGNQGRAQQIQLWEHLISVSKPPPHETAQARKQREQTVKAFLGYVKKTFAPRNCTALYKLP